MTIAFTDKDLRKYIEALFQRFELGSVEISDKPVHMDERYLSFRGRAGRQRNLHLFVVPFFNYRPGVIGAMSILCSSGRAEMSWLVNGQANKGCTELFHIGSISDQVVTLHASLADLKNFVYSRLENVPAEKQEDVKRRLDADLQYHLTKDLYGEEVSIGHYSVNDEGNLKRVLQPISSESFTFESDETVITPNI